MPESSSPDKPTRRQREQIARRLDIMAAAESVFAAKGYHEASIAEIAKTAEFAPGTVYLYFNGKEALYASVFEHKIEGMLKLVGEKIADSKDSVQKLADLVSAQFEFYGQNRDFFRIFTSLRLDATGNKEDWNGVWKLYRDFLETIESVITEGQDSGKFRTGDKHQLALALLGVVNMLVRGWLANDSEEELTGQKDFAVDFLLNGIGT